MKEKSNRRAKPAVTTLVNFILDKSGSMGSIQSSVISGFNEYINGLKNKGGKIKFSLTMFDTESIDKPYIDADIKTVEPLTQKTYRPNAGTPLYDAVVDTIEAVNEKVENKKDVAVITVILTDGEENSSVKHDEKCMRDLIKKLEKKGNWTFTFMGANIDAYDAANKFGISRGNTVSWSSDVIGTQNAFRGLAMASSAYAMTMQDNSAKGIALNANNVFESVKDLIENGGEANDSQS